MAIPKVKITIEFLSNDEGNLDKEEIVCNGVFVIGVEEREGDGDFLIKTSGNLSPKTAMALLKDSMGEGEPKKDIEYM